MTNRLSRGLLTSVGLGALVALHGIAHAQVFEVTIDAKANIFYAGTDLTPYPQNCAVTNRFSNNGLGDGVYPAHIQLNPGLRAIQISSRNTQDVTYAASFERASTPDGRFHAEAVITTSTNPSGTMPGLHFANRLGMLAAVFLDDTTLNSSANVSVNSFDGVSMNAPVLNYGLRDTFYLGDGTVVDWGVQPGVPDGTQQRQTLVLPAGATRLFFGLTDAFALNGPNECFMDNTGQIIAALQMGISDDSGAVSEGQGGVAIADVKTNDYFTAAVEQISVRAIEPPAGSTEGAAWANGIALQDDGSVTVEATVPQGEYSAWYELCDASTTPASCTQALVTVNVLADARNPIEANPNSGAVSQSLGGVAIADVRVNDYLNQALATAENTTLTAQGVWPSGISLDTASGAVNVAAGTAVGTYAGQYRLCETAVPSNCVFTTATVTVSASAVSPIAAANDEPPAVEQGFEGTVLDSVFGNDSFNQDSATAGLVTAAPGSAWPAGIALDADTGAVSITAAAAPGSYQLPYQLCERATPTNCSTAFVRMTITAASAPLAPVSVPVNSAWLLALMGLAMGAVVVRRKNR